MTDRSLRIYQGEDLSPEVDLTDMAKWETSEFGTRAFRGEATSSQVTIRDKDGRTGNAANLPSGMTNISLAAKNVVKFVHGSNIIWQGRMGEKNYSKGGEAAGRYREADAYLEDVNIDLRGIVVHGWSRPAETDVARIQSLLARYLSGDPRATTNINGSNLVNSGSNLVTLPAHTYNQTSTDQVISDIATAANKTYYLLPPRTTGTSYTAELFYDGADAVMEQSPFRISDREDEVRANPSTTFFPIWNVGPATTENGQELISGVWLFYGENNYVHVSDETQANQYAHWEEVIFDDSIETEAEATARARAILSFRKYEERVINVTIGPLNDDQLPLIRAGQSIPIKARAIPFADDQDYTGKIGQLKITSPVAHTFFVHLQIDRPWRMEAYGSGTPVGPKPAPGSTPAITEFHWTWNEVDPLGGFRQAFTDHTGTDWYMDDGASIGNPSYRTGTAGETIPNGGGVRAVTAVAGVEYTFAAVLAPRGDTAPVDLNVVFADAGGSVLATEIIAAVASAPHSFASYSATFTAPSGTARMNFGLRGEIDDFLVTTGGSGGSTTQPVGDDGSGTPGEDDGTYVGPAHVHEHGKLSPSGTHHHGTAQIEGYSAGSGAPTDVNYLVGTASGDLSAEIVVGTTPGGELGGTWASPTVDTTHAGSTHDAATNTHIADSSDAHDASAISYDNSTSGMTATDVQAAIDELEAGGGGGGASDLDDLTDVDTTTIAPSDGDVLTYDDADSLWKPAAASGGGGGVSWDQVADETGASFTNFTSHTGTWASDGTIISQTDTTATARRAKWNTMVPHGFDVIHEAEIRFPTTGAGAGGTRRGGILAQYHHTSTGGLALFLVESGNQVSLERDAVSAIRSITHTVAKDTWYKLRIVVGTAIVSIYIDGVLKGTASVYNLSGPLEPDFVGLYAYGTRVDFRNIKTWTLTGGAPA